MYSISFICSVCICSWLIVILDIFAFGLQNIYPNKLIAENPSGGSMFYLIIFIIISQLITAFYIPCISIKHKMNMLISVCNNKISSSILSAVQNIVSRCFYRNSATSISYNSKNISLFGSCCLSW